MRHGPANEAPNPIQRWVGSTISGTLISTFLLFVVLPVAVVGIVDDADGARVMAVVGGVLFLGACGVVLYRLKTIGKDALTSQSVPYLPWFRSE